MKTIEKILYENYKSNVKLHKIKHYTISYEIWLKEIFNKKVKI